MAKRFWRIVDSVKFPLLVTNGEDGYLWAEPTHLVDWEGGTL